MMKESVSLKDLIGVTFKCNTDEGVRDILVFGKDFRNALFVLDCVFGVKEKDVVDYMYW